MKYPIVCTLVLLAVANTLAQHIVYPGSNQFLNPLLTLNPSVSRQWPPDAQMWHAQDELGRANFGYSYPGQAAVNYRDIAGNMIGSWSYINPNGKLVATSYIADDQGYRVLSNDLPVAPVVPEVVPVVPVVPEVVPVSPVKVIPVEDATETKPTAAPMIVKPVQDETIAEPEIKDPNAVTIAGDLQCLKERRKRQIPDGVYHMVASKQTIPNQYPFMVSLTSYNDTLDAYTHDCGASLISSTKLLTAAHCVTYTDSTVLLDKEGFQAHLGMHFLNLTATDTQVTRKIVKMVIHENYDPDSNANDVAILTLDSPVEYTETISPICLAPKCMNVKFVGRTITAMSWGRTEEGGEVSEYLQHAWLKVIPNAECRETYGKVIDYRTFCTYKDGQDTCQGDSGGPLITDFGSDSVDCRFVQVGIVSFGHGCARKGVPGVYMKVTAYLDWIQNNLN